MRKIIAFVLAALMIFGLCACGGEGATGGKKDEGLQVGFGRESIVPDITGVEIAGGDASARLSDGYRDEVAATCIAIREGDQTILLYTLDFIVVDKNVYAAQPAIAEATGVPEENIEQFEEKFDRVFGQNAALSPRNIVETGKFEVKTPDVVIKCNPARTDLVETRVIDGVKYVLIRADGGVEVNGIDVKIEE